MGHSPLPKEAYGQTVGQVYLLHFLGEGIAHGPQARVKHYLGWAEDAEARIAKHMRGTSRARLMEVVKERGVSFTVARVWDGVTREFERRLKNQGGLSRHCPVCIAEGTDRKALNRERRRRKREEGVPVAPPAPSTGPDYAEAEERVGEEFGKRGGTKEADRFMGQTEGGIPSSGIITVYRGTPKPESSPYPRAFAAVFLSLSPEAAGQYGEHVAKYSLDLGMHHILDIDDPHAVPLAKQYMRIEGWSGMDSLSDDDIDDFMANYFMFPEAGWVRFLRHRGYTGTSIGGDVALFLLKGLHRNGTVRIAASHRLLPEGVRVTVKRERMPGPGDFYAGHIWKDYQYAGPCPVVSEIPSRAREAAIDWAWKMFPEESPRREKTASGELVPVGIGSLPPDTQDDIAYALSHGSSFLSRSGYDEADILANLSGLADEPTVLAGPAPVDALYRTMRPRGISEAAVRKYTDRLASDPDFEFGPIVTVNGRLYEGGHRLEAYRRAGRETIPVAEIANLMYATDEAWRRWMEGDSSITAEQVFPVRASLGKAAYDYKEMFRAILSELGELDKLAGSGLAIIPPHKADQEVNSWVNWGRRVLQKQDRIIWYLRLGQLKWADYLAKAYQWDNKPEEAVRWTEWVKAKAQQFDPPMTPQGAASTDMHAVRSRLEHFLSLPIPEIQGTVFLRQQPGGLLGGFSRLEKDWRDRQSHLLLPHEGDREAVGFPDGWAWWVLDRSYCPEEARAMGHCGNEATGPSRPDDRILSLRRRVVVRNTEYLEPHLTFILGEDGLLGEMKGRGNEKPSPRYHPYIVRLLEQTDLVRGIVGGGYMPEHNFSLDDLPPEQRERVKKANRSLVSASDMYSESRGNMTDELLQRIAERTLLKKGQWSPEHEAFVVNKYANPEWFISTAGSGWLKAQMMLARGGFGKHPGHQVVEEGVRDLLAVLEDGERKALADRMPFFLRHGFPSVLAPPGQLSFDSPEHEEEYRRLWGTLAAAWEAGVTGEMRQAALDRVRGFLGSNHRYNHVRTNDISRVAFPEANDPDFWKKPVRVEVSIEDAVHLASPSDSSYEGRGYSGGDDTAIAIDDYWETSHGTTMYDASIPYKRLTLPEDLKRALDLKVGADPQAKGWSDDFLNGRPYEYLRWLRREVPAIFEQEMTPGAWDEDKARTALMRMLGKKG